MININRNLLLSCVLLIAGCGFHLRGLVDMPTWLDNISVIIHNANQELCPLLNQQLHALHAHTTSIPAQAHYWLILDNETIQQQITNVSSSTTPRQYQLTYRVSFTLRQPNGKEIIPETYITVTRIWTQNSNLILGSNDEANTFISEMRREASIQIIDHLGALNDH